MKKAGKNPGVSRNGFAIRGFEKTDEADFLKENYPVKFKKK